MNIRVGLLQLVAATLSFGLLGCGGDTTVSGGPIFRTEVSCSNLVDDDGDNLVDCNDPDCRFDPSCATGTATYTLKNLQTAGWHSFSLRLQFDANLIAFVAAGPIDILLRDLNGDGLADMNCEAVNANDLLDLVGGDGLPDTAPISCTHREPLGEVSGPGYLYEFDFTWAGVRPTGCNQVQVLNLLFRDAAGVPLSAADSETECLAQISP